MLENMKPSLPTEFLDKLEGIGEDMGEVAEGETVFKGLEMPAPSVHKTWGQDPEIDDVNVW